MKKTITFIMKNGETFEARFNAGPFHGMVEGKLYEVRPNPKWWQFKKVEVRHSTFFPEDFQYNFERMGMALVAGYLKERKHENNLKEMWK